jgi:arylformamidase
MEAVFLDYDQKALDDAYDQTVYASNAKQLLLRRRANSEMTRQQFSPERLAYGSGINEQIDLYRARSANAPIQLFIHGGAWRIGRASECATPAELFLHADINYVAIDFDNIEEAGGSLFPMAEQVRAAVAWVFRNAPSFGADPSQLFVSGGSSGAHLGGVVATTDWKNRGLPAEIVKGYVLCSGMYDLRGPRLSKRGKYVRFTDEMEHILSPQRHIDFVQAPITLIYGSFETPEFKRQTQEFAKELKKAGKMAELVCGEGYNHYEIQETLANPYGHFGKAVLKQMNRFDRFGN